MLKYISIVIITILMLFAIPTRENQNVVEVLEPIDPTDLVSRDPIELFPEYNNLVLNDLPKDVQTTIRCLAGNIYFEARSESIEGQMAVAFVTINRMISRDFPDNICSVVKQKNRRLCQFSWYCQTKERRRYYTTNLSAGKNKTYNEIVHLALFIYNNHQRMNDPTKGSLYYHASYVKPNWKHLYKSVVIGRHIFYVDNRKS